MRPGVVLSLCIGCACNGTFAATLPFHAAAHIAIGESKSPCCCCEANKKCNCGCQTPAKDLNEDSPQARACPCKNPNSLPPASERPPELSRTRDMARVDSCMERPSNDGIASPALAARAHNPPVLTPPLETIVWLL